MKNRRSLKTLSRRVRRTESVSGRSNNSALMRRTMCFWLLDLFFGSCERDRLQRCHTVSDVCFSYSALKTGTLVKTLSRINHRRDFLATREFQTMQMTPAGLKKMRLDSTEILKKKVWIREIKKNPSLWLCVCVLYRWKVAQAYCLLFLLCLFSSCLRPSVFPRRVQPSFTQSDPIKISSSRSTETLTDISDQFMQMQKKPCLTFLYVRARCGLGRSRLYMDFMNFKKMPDVEASHCT